VPLQPLALLTLLNPRFRKNVQPEREATGLALLHVVMDHQEWKTLTIVEVTLHVAILQEAIRANVHQEEDDMMTIAEIMEEGALPHQEDGLMMDMVMDHHLHDEHRMIMILTIDEDHHLLVATLTRTEVEIHMLGQEVLHQGTEVAMADTRREDTQDDIGKFSTFLLLTGCPRLRGKSCRGISSFSFC
jgi:hypothetical protein